MYKNAPNIKATVSKSLTIVNYFFLWLGNLMGIQNSILYFLQMTVLTTTVQFRCFWTDLNNFFSFDLEFWLGFPIRYCTFPKWLSGPQKSNFVVSGPIWIIFFFFDLEIRWGFQIRYFELRFYECCHSCFNKNDI